MGAGRRTGILLLPLLLAGTADAASLDDPRLPRTRPAPPAATAEPVNLVPADLVAGPADDMPAADAEEPEPAEASDTTEAASLGPRLPRARPGREPAALAEPVEVALAGATPVYPSAAPEIPPSETEDIADGTTIANDATRLPRHRPAVTPAILNSPAVPQVELARAPAVPPVSAAEETACRLRLDELDVTYTVEEPIDPAGMCSVAAPLKVTGLGSGVSLAPEAIMNCATAESLALWTRDVLVPKAKAEFGAAPTGITHASTYVCRPRNNVPGAKLSEHAHANAVDIASISFAGRTPLPIEDVGPAKDRKFQMDVRKGACEYFTTVLGPGSNAAHATHFHFDMAHRRGGYRLCDLGTPAEVVTTGAVNTSRE